MGNSLQKRTWLLKVLSKRKINLRVWANAMSWRWFFFFVGATTGNLRVLQSIVLVDMVNHTAIVNNDLRLSANVTTCPSPNVTRIITEKKHSGEFNWNSEMQGAILGTNNLAYLLSSIPAGRMAEKWGAKPIVFYSSLISALFCIVNPFLAWWNVYAFIIMQFIRGTVQGLVTPTAYLMMANWYPPSERILLSPWLGFGYPLGGMASSIISGYICDAPSLGWPYSFYIIGGFNLLFAAVFLFVYFETPQKNPRISNEELKYITESLESDMNIKRPPTPWKAMFTTLSVYALIIGNFGFYWQMAYFLNIHPIYLGTVLNYSMTQNGLINSLPLLLTISGGFCSSLICNSLAKRECFSRTTLRKGCHLIGSLVFSICILSIIAAGCNHTLNLVAFFLGSFVGGSPFAVISTVPVEMTPKFAGSMSGIIVATGTSAMILLPVITGALTKNELPSEWNTVFILSACICAFCSIVFALFGSADIQPWNFVDDDDKKTNNAKSLTEKDKTKGTTKL